MRYIAIIISILSATLMANWAYANNNKIVIAVVVDNKQNSDALKLSTKNLNLIYWRKQRFWPNGVRIKPVNLRAQNPIRMQFSKTTLGSTPKSQIDFWNAQYFNGILPPHAVDSEEAVLRYVASTKGAIGYVNACQLDQRVKPLLWIVDGKLTQVSPTISCP